MQGYITTSYFFVCCAFSEPVSKSDYVKLNVQITAQYKLKTI